MSAWYKRPLEWIFSRRSKKKSRSYSKRVRDRERELRRRQNGEATHDKEWTFDPFNRLNTRWNWATSPVVRNILAFPRVLLRLVYGHNKAATHTLHSRLLYFIVTSLGRDNKHGPHSSSAARLQWGLFLTRDKQGWVDLNLLWISRSWQYQVEKEIDEVSCLYRLLPTIVISRCSRDLQLRGSVDIQNRTSMAYPRRRLHLSNRNLRSWIHKREWNSEWKRGIKKGRRKGTKRV